jgi:hypothetical protein
MQHYQTRIWPGWACPALVRNLNRSNRPVRTRMPGGVGGVAEETRRPYPDLEILVGPRRE